MFGGKENLVREFPLEFIAHKIVIQIGRIPHTIPISKEENKFGFALTKLQYLLFSQFPGIWGKMANFLILIFSFLPEINTFLGF